MSMRACACVLALLVLVVALPVDVAHSSSAAASVSPKQIRLALADDMKSSSVDSKGMAVTWVTEGSADSIVRYGVASGEYTMEMKGSSSQYKYLDYTSGHIHKVVLKNLAPNTVYYYQVGAGLAGADSAASDEFSFLTTVPVDGDAPVVLGVIGDLGQTSDSRATVDHILTDKTVTNVVIAGDISYADGKQPRWDSWGEMFEDLTASHAVMVGPGNHEVEKHDGEEPFLAFQARWKMPSEECGAQAGNQWFSFNLASMHVISLNSYADYDSDSQQYKWLKKDLENVDRSLTPWIVVMLHAPWYNSDTAHHDEKEELGMRASMEALLHSHHANLVISGHVHAYERMKPSYANHTDASGSVYIVVGCGGNHEGLAKHYIDPQPEWSAFREASFGHGRIEVFNRTHAAWTWHKNSQEEYEVADSVMIVQDEDHNMMVHEWVQGFSL